MSDGPSINLWSWITGAIGVTTVLPLLYALVMAQIPLSKIKDLEEAIDDTKYFLDSVVERGLLSDGHYIAQSKRALVGFEAQAIDLKLSAYSAKTTTQQIKCMITGVSYAIYRLCQRVNKLRADISETTSKAQMRLQNEGGESSLSADDATSVSAPSSLASEQDIGRESVDIADLSDPLVLTVEIPYEHCEIPTLRHKEAEEPICSEGSDCRDPLASSEYGSHHRSIDRSLADRPSTHLLWLCA